MVQLNDELCLRQRITKHVIGDMSPLPFSSISRYASHPKSHGQLDQYTEAEQKLFATYHSLFKIGSKPAEHLQAMSELSEADLKATAPSTLNRLVEAVKTKLAGLPE